MGDISEADERRARADELRVIVGDPGARVILSAEAALPEELSEPPGGDRLSRRIDELISRGVGGQRPAAE